MLIVYQGNNKIDPATKTFTLSFPIPYVLGNYNPCIEDAFYLPKGNRTVKIKAFDKGGSSSEASLLLNIQNSYFDQVIGDLENLKRDISNSDLSSADKAFMIATVNYWEADINITSLSVEQYLQELSTYRDAVNSWDGTLDEEWISSSADRQNIQNKLNDTYNILNNDRSHWPQYPLAIAGWIIVGGILVGAFALGLVLIHKHTCTTCAIGGALILIPCAVAAVGAAADAALTREGLAVAVAGTAVAGGCAKVLQPCIDAC